MLRARLARGAHRCSAMRCWTARECCLHVHDGWHAKAGSHAQYSACASGAGQRKAPIGFAVFTHCCTVSAMEQTWLGHARVQFYVAFAAFAIFRRLHFCCAFQVLRVGELGFWSLHLSCCRHASVAIYMCAWNGATSKAACWPTIPKLSAARHHCRHFTC